METESNSSFQFPPGFRFHPSDEELIVHYLLNKVKSRQLPASVITEIELYNYNPWDLPKKALFGEEEWYFFSPRDRKYPNGARPKRSAASGYWKATGTDKPILTSSGSKRIGVKKALVFYTGRPPKGMKTDWIMNEYRLPETMNRPSKLKASMRLDDWVLCRVRQKGNMSKNTWEVGSPRKEPVGCLSKIQELPSPQKEPYPDVITDYLLYKDCHPLPYMLDSQTLPPMETISSPSFQYNNEGNNCGSSYQDNFFSPSKAKLANEVRGYQNVLPSTKMVSNDNKNEDLLPGNTLPTKNTNLYSHSPSQGDIFNPNPSDAIITLQELNQSFFTERFLQQ
ncbi:NAC domain-containing protein 1-like [Cornus florida]|uniref:NAC domain-containing protein 1-like n=1 Tax=Cornus florida TaxID=4283 RepID=UPI002896A875|nr:NAC domain-containing protein 1-like [Cornus florida]